MSEHFCKFFFSMIVCIILYGRMVTSCWPLIVVKRIPRVSTSRSARSRASMELFRLMSRRTSSRRHVASVSTASSRCRCINVLMRSTGAGIILSHFSCYYSVLNFNMNLESWNHKLLFIIFYHFVPKIAKCLK